MAVVSGAGASDRAGADVWSELPAEVLVDILRRSPQNQRLGTCTCVATAWAAAAKEATDSVVLVLPSPARLQAAWLSCAARLGEHLTSLKLGVDAGGGGGGSIVLQDLPCARLQELSLHNVSLHKGGSTQAQTGGAVVGGLHAVTRLTRLCVVGGSLLGDCASLASLTSLQHLHLSARYSGRALPSRVLQALSQLTHLHLRGYPVAGNFSLDDSSLPNLQHLAVLEGYWSGGNSWVGGVTKLSSLTCLELSTSFAPKGSLANLVALTSLQRLCLHEQNLGVPALVDPAVFAGITCLRRVEFHGVSFGPNGVRTMLSWLQEQPMLEYLVWKHSSMQAWGGLSEPDVPPDGCFSRLRKLVLVCAGTPGGIWQRVFATGRQLLHLTSLDFDLHVPAWHGYSGYASYSSPPSAAQMQRLVECCPQLRELRLCACNRSYGRGSLSWLSPSVLVSLLHLSALTVDGMTSASAPQLAELSCLQELRSVRLVEPCSVAAVAAQHLTSLQQLTCLSVESRNLPGVSHLELTSKAGSSPVWSQLLACCQQMAEERQQWKEENEREKEAARAARVAANGPKGYPLRSSRRGG